MIPFLRAVLVALAVLVAMADPAAAADTPRLCRDIFSEPAAQSASAIDPGYQATIKSWRSAWNDNRLNRMFRAEPNFFRADSLKIEDFLNAREFRSWFENQSRTAESFQQDGGSSDARVKLLVDPQEALAAKLLAIRSAKHTVDLAYYKLSYDDVGHAFIDEIRAAIARGVSVRLLVDSTGSINRHSELRALIAFAKEKGGQVVGLDGAPTGKRASIEVVVFNPISRVFVNSLRQMLRTLINLSSDILGSTARPLDPLGYSINRRSHDKLLLIDGAFVDRAIGFIGGRNLVRHYYPTKNEARDAFSDLEVMLASKPSTEAPENALNATHPDQNGSSIGIQLTTYFDKIYFHLGNKIITRSLLGLAIGYDAKINEIMNFARRAREKMEFDLDSATVRQDLLESGFSEEKVEIVNTFHNLYRKNPTREFELRDHQAAIKNSSALMKNVEALLVKEEKEVVLVSPYLWLSSKQIRLLKAWLLKDPTRRLKIITSSVISSDVPLSQVLTDNVLGPALKLDRGIVDGNGNTIRRSISDQVDIYLYGRKDSTFLGGDKDYGRLHAKGAFFRSLQKSVIGTFNNDPRSLLINSEGAAIIEGTNTNLKFSKYLDRLTADSHLWGSDEQRQIQADRHLPYTTRLIAQSTERFYDLLIKFKLWWLL